METLDKIPLITYPKQTKNKIYKNRYLLAKKLTITVHKQDHEDQFQSHSQGSNLFKEKPSENEFKAELGPRYNSYGELIKYTVVGNTDWFIHQQQGGRRANFDETSMKFANTKTKQAEEDKQQARTFDTRSAIKRMSVVMSVTRKSKVKDQFRTKNQISDEIQQIKNRIDSNRKTEEQQLTLMNPVAKRFLSKQSRILDSYDKSSNEWERFVQKASTNLDRKPEMSQYYRSDAYRSKLEVANTLEHMKTNAERFGNNLWYLTLRNQLPIQSNTTKVSSNQSQYIPEQDHRASFSSLGEAQQSIEFIRRPPLSHFDANQSSSITLSHTPAPSSLPYNSFTSDKYLKQKIGDLSSFQGMKKQMNLDSIQGGEDQLMNLVIHGQAQFDREAQVAQIYGHEQGFRKVALVNTEDQEAEEVILQNYSYRERYLLPKINKKVTKSQLQFKRSPSICTPGGSQVFESQKFIQ